MGEIKDSRMLSIDTTALVVLMDNVYRGSEHPNVGYEDAYIPFDMFAARLNKQHWLNIQEVESALWSCNLMNEEGKFWHPRGISFDEFIESLKLTGYKFDRTFNTLDREGVEQ